MPSIQIKSNSAFNFTPISNEFILKYMPYANGTYVKVYLLVIHYTMFASEDFSTKFLANQLNMLESDVIESLKYWESQGLLSLEQNAELINLSFEDKKEKKLKEPSNVVNQSLIEKQPIKKSRPHYSAQELQYYAKNVQEINRLFKVCQHYIGKPLQPNDLDIIYSFYDWLRLPLDVIETLIEYCVANNHRKLNYMEKVAIEWAEKNIDTVEKAKAQIHLFSKDYYAIIKIFGMTNRNLVPQEISYLDTWFKTYGFTKDIIAEACNRTIASISQPSFKYADKILSNWYKNNVKCLEDIPALDKAYAANKDKSSQKNQVTSSSKVTPFKQNKTNNKFNNFKQRTDWNFDEIMKLEQEYLEKDLIK